MIDALQVQNTKLYLNSNNLQTNLFFICSNKDSYMANSAQGQTQKYENIKKFQSRVINRSVIDAYVYDKIADYLLQCCSAQAKPNTLSIMSVIPLIIGFFVITPGTSLGYFLLIAAIFIHQVLDIANKKQAYRLSQFTFNTYYMDHMYDSISCGLVVYLIASALQLQNESILSCVYFFGMLPFFTHHLAMYSGGYLTFHLLSPGTQGLFVFQIFFLVCGFIPKLPQTQIAASIKISGVIIVLCSIWLIVFLIDDLKTISKMRTVLQIDNGNSDKVPIKNILVICILGYIMMEIAIVEGHMLDNSIYFHIIYFLFLIVFSLIISELLLAYGYNQKFKQIQLHTLIVMAVLVILYSICGFSSMVESAQVLMGQIAMGIILGLETGYFFYSFFTNVKVINKILRQDQ